MSDIKTKHTPMEPIQRVFALISIMGLALTLLSQPLNLNLAFITPLVPLGMVLNNLYKSYKKGEIIAALGSTFFAIVFGASIILALLIL